MDQVEFAQLKKSKVVLISKTRSDYGKKHYKLQWMVRDFHQLHLNTLYNGPYIQIGNDVSQFQLYTSYMGPMELTTEKFVLLGLSPDPQWAEVESMVVVGTRGVEATPLSLDSGRLAYALDLPDRFSYYGFEVEDNTKDLLVSVVLVTGQHDRGNFLRTLERVEECCTLAEDMGELLRKEIYSDLVIQAGKKQFNVHKSILHARSESFAALLEKHPHHITLKLETDGEATGEILHHIYTHKTKPYDVNMTVKLLPLASDFGLKDLKMFLRDHLADILTPERALKMAVDCNRSGKHDVRDCAIESIGNRLEAAMELLEWDRFARFVPMVNHVLRYVAKRFVKGSR